MSDIRSLRNKLNANSVSNIKFTLNNDLNVGGYKVDLSWLYDFDPKRQEIIGFKIYKAVLSQPKLKKSYLINQKALEKLTSTKSFSTQTTTLYNKSVFSQNSKLKFESSNSTKHDKTEGEISKYKYINISFVSFDKKKSLEGKFFQFCDRNVKFGETYSYYITALTKNLQETSPVPVLVNVENLSHPKNLTTFKISETDLGLLLIFGNNQDRNIGSFKIFKREDGENQFKLLADVVNNSEFVFFTDTDILPKRTYVYRIYSVDLFGTLSLFGLEERAVFRFGNPLTNIEYTPSIIVDSVDDLMRIRIRNERPDKLSTVRIERKDNWKFDTFFEIKSYNEIPLPNNIFFDENNLIEIVDRTTAKGRGYTYRITGFNKIGMPLCYYTTPIIQPGEKIFVNNLLDATKTDPKILNFNIEVVNDKQDPIYVKCNWNIIGDWSYLLLKTGQEEIKIDFIHNEVFLNNFKKGQRYEITVDLYDLNEVKFQELRGIILKT